MNHRFENRAEAGRLLAGHLRTLAKEDLSKYDLDDFKDALILALPRGGVPIAYEISKALGLPIDVLMVRKIGAPFHPEFGIGAVVEEGYHWIDKISASRVGATQRQIDEI